MKKKEKKFNKYITENMDKMYEEYLKEGQRYTQYIRMRYGHTANFYPEKSKSDLATEVQIYRDNDPKASYEKIIRKLARSATGEYSERQARAYVHAFNELKQQGLYEGNIPTQAMIKYDTESADELNKLMSEYNLKMKDDGLGSYERRQMITSLFFTGLGSD